LREDETRSSSQSRQSGSEDSQRLFNSARSRGSRDHRNYRNHFRSSPDKPSTPRPSRPYAVGLAAQLSQRRKQLEARAKEKLKMEKENLAGSPAVDTESVKVNSPSVRETNKRKVVIEICDDEEQNVTPCQKEASVDLSDTLPQVSVKTDDMSVKDDGDSTGTADSSSSSSSDADSAQNDSGQCDAGNTSTTQQTSVDCSAAKLTASTLSLMNLPMPPVASESDSEATPASTEELQL